MRGRPRFPVSFVGWRHRLITLLMPVAAIDGCAFPSGKRIQLRNVTCGLTQSLGGLA